MKIDNRTTYKTEHLRAFLARVAFEELEPAHAARVTVVVRPTRGRHVRGRAFVGGTWMELKLPVGSSSMRPQVALVIAHEMAHLRGLRHRAMHGSPRYSTLVHGWYERYCWANDLPLETEEKPKPKRPTGADLAETRRQHAEQKHREAVTRLKRAQALEKRWRLRIRYYERRLAALTTTPQKESE